MRANILYPVHNSPQTSAISLEDPTLRISYRYNMDKALVYFLLLQVSTGEGQAKEQPWRQLPMLEALCPGQNVCPEATSGNQSVVHSANDNVGCCTECSCDPSCGYHGDCCFPEMDTVRDRSDQECLYDVLVPPTNYLTSHIKSFYMVTKEPVTGCVAKVSSSIVGGSCCETDVAPWGSFLPVWSPGKGRIYKNRLYADCHGVNDYIMWDAIQYCTEVKELDSDFSGCNVDFNFPGRTEELRSEQCVTDLFSTCPDDFVVENEVDDLTKQEIIDGCHSDFISVYGYVFPVKNVYCYICMTSPPLLPRSPCVGPPGGKSSAAMSRFVNYLSRKYLTDYRQGQNEIPEKACEMAEDKMITASCRQAFCPTGRIYSAVERKCTFASRLWNVGKLEMMFFLTLDEPIHNLTYERVWKLMSSDLDFQVDLPKDWMIDKVLIPIFDNVSLNSNWRDALKPTIHEDNLQRPATEIVLSIFSKYKTANPSKFVKQIQTRLRGKWSVRFGETELKASARLDNFSLVYHGIVIDLGMVHVPLSMGALYSNGSMMFNESKAFLQLKTEDKLVDTVDVVSKLYFCRQIELQSHEFILLGEHSPVAMLLVKNNMFLYDKEFKLQKKSDDSTTARICLQDAGYNLFPHTSSAPLLQTGVYIDIVLYLLHILMQN